MVSNWSRSERANGGGGSAVEQCGEISVQVSGKNGGLVEAERFLYTLIMIFMYGSQAGTVTCLSAAVEPPSGLDNQIAPTVPHYSLHTVVFSITKSNFRFVSNRNSR